MMPKAEFSVCAMDESTVHAVAMLAKSCFSTPWSEDIYRRELQNPMGFTLVCKADETVVGFINCGYVLDELTLNTLAVDTNYRRQGIGTLLWNAAAAKMRGICRVCYLEVRESNLPARTLYAALGFTQNGYRPRYYQQPEEAAVLMQADLI